MKQRTQPTMHELREIALSPGLLAGLSAFSPDEAQRARMFELGQCLAVVSYRHGRCRLTITGRDRRPSMGEILAARDLLCPPAVTMGVILWPAARRQGRAAHVLTLCELPEFSVAPLQGRSMP